MQQEGNSNCKDSAPLSSEQLDQLVPRPKRKLNTKVKPFQIIPSTLGIRFPKSLSLSALSYNPNEILRKTKPLKRTYDKVPAFQRKGLGQPLGVIDNLVHLNIPPPTTKLIERFEAKETSCKTFPLDTEEVQTPQERRISVMDQKHLYELDVSEIKELDQGKSRSTSPQQRSVADILTYMNRSLEGSVTEENPIYLLSVRKPKSLKTFEEYYNRRNPIKPKFSYPNRFRQQHPQAQSMSASLPDAQITVLQQSGLMQRSYKLTQTVSKYNPSKYQRLQDTCISQQTIPMQQPQRSNDGNYFSQIIGKRIQCEKALIGVNSKINFYQNEIRLLQKEEGSIDDEIQMMISQDFVELNFTEILWQKAVSHPEDMFLYAQLCQWIVAWQPLTVSTNFKNQISLKVSEFHQAHQLIGNDPVSLTEQTPTTIKLLRKEFIANLRLIGLLFNQFLVTEVELSTIQKNILRRYFTLIKSYENDSSNNEVLLEGWLELLIIIGPRIIKHQTQTLPNDFSSLDSLVESIIQIGDEQLGFGRSLGFISRLLSLLNEEQKFSSSLKNLVNQLMTIHGFPIWQ